MSTSIVARRSAAALMRLPPALVVAGLVLLMPGLRPAAAKGDDVCPEANDTFQAACFLGVDSDALGFISRRDDVDAYRFEVRDYGVTVRVSLSERPLPYRLNLANWNAEVVATGEDGTLQTRLNLPGSYYVFVDSATGAFSDSAPYRIVYSVTYASQPVPQVLYSSEFRGGPRDIIIDSGTNQYQDDDAIVTIDHGRTTIQLTRAGTPEEPVSTTMYFPPDPPDPGPIVEDFTMSIDVRVTSGDDAGYEVLFRHVDEDNLYSVAVSMANREISLNKVVDGQLVDITDWIDAPTLIEDGVNRMVIRAVGEEIRVNLNGRELIREKDGSFKRGIIGFGAITYGEPASVNFDNILVTTPTRR